MSVLEQGTLHDHFKRAYHFTMLTFSCCSHRHFIKETLPTVQYNNPSIEYEIVKSPEAAMKPLLTVSFGKLTFCVLKL